MTLKPSRPRMPKSVRNSVWKLGHMERNYSSDAGNLAKELVRLYPASFTSDFEENKTLVEKALVTKSKLLRNEVAGQITRLKTREASGQSMTTPYVPSTNDSRRRRRRTRRR